MELPVSPAGETSINKIITQITKISSDKEQIVGQRTDRMGDLPESQKAGKCSQGNHVALKEEQEE